MKYLHRSLLPLLLCAVTVARAQTFRSRASLGTTATTGFYIIPVTQALAAHCKADLTDIRVADANGTWIPHIIKQPTTKPTTGGYLAFPMQYEPNSRGGYTQIRADNSSGRLLGNLVLQLKNADVRRSASLSGSYDGINWFIISENLQLFPAAATNGSNHAQQLRFSPADYRFFKVKINNRKTDPLLVTGIGTEVDTATADSPAVEWNPPTVCRQEEAGGGITRLTVTAPMPAHFNGLAIDVAAPQLYQRNVTVFVTEPADTVTGQKVLVDRFVLQSGRQSVRTVAVKARLFYLSIENKDNPPLRITAVRTFRDKHYLITWLEAGKSYFLLAGNEAVAAAEYDLEQFSNQLQPVTDTLRIGPFEAVTVPVPPGKTDQSVWLWPLIGAGLLALGLLTWRLLADMKKKGI